MSCHYTLHHDIAVLTLDSPPINSLGHQTRLELAQNLERAEHDAAVRATIITGAGNGFSGGADIREFGTSKMAQEPGLHSVIRIIESCGKPVIAAIHGTCMGGGLELALACHYRVTAPGASIALPEVKLGLLPGAGGTQRLPRAAGVETALNMIVSGEPVKSELLAAGSRLFDRLIEGDFISGALAFAREAAQKPGPHPLLRHQRLEYADADAYFQFARNMVKATSRNFPAPLRCVDCVEAAVRRRFDDGLAFESEQFLALLHSRESQALRHAFFGERAASKIADVPETTPLREIRGVGVIGAGTMGGGIAMNFLNAGLPVTLLESQQAALDRGLATIRRNYESQVKKGKLKPEKLEQRMALLKPTLRYEDLAQADLIIEAVFEEMGVKRTVFGQLDNIAKPGAILASNTSTLNLDEIAAATRRPQDVVGLHFFSPANVMKLLEVVRGRATAKDVLATVMKMAKTIRKTAVVSGVCDGFIGNRMIEQYGRQAGFMLDEGALPAQVDRAIEAFGFAMGPFRMGDLAGNDIGWAIRKRRAVEQPGMKYSKTADLLCEQGRFGQKTGAGWYDYPAGSRTAQPSEAVNAMIAAHRKSLGIAPRTISDEEIVQRLLLSLVNEGARILEEGIAAKASDIDMVYLSGYGFPLWRGGPMLYADQLGLREVLRLMRGFQRNPLADPEFWTPAPLLLRLAETGKTFN